MSSHRRVWGRSMTYVETYLEDIWSKTKQFMKSSGYVDAIVYDTYFDESSLKDLSESKAVIVVPTQIQKVILLQETGFISSSLKTVLDKDLDCDIYTQFEYAKRPSSTSISQNIIEGLDEDGVLSFYTFDNFVVGPSNKESHSAALACAYNPGKFYNPLFIFGNSGLGKTHLLNAIGNYVKKNYPDKRVLYTSGADFVTRVVSSIKDNSIEEFKLSMQMVDVLLMDDIQFLAGKEKSHEIFFYIFNDLVNNRRQIVLTSDRHPQEIKGLEERLISRFSSGLSVGVDSPEFETSLAILKKKMEYQSVDPTFIEDDVLAYIATNFSKDVRKLEGALNRLLFYSINFSNSGRIDFKTAVSAFKGQATVNDKNELSPNKIKRVVADYYGLTKQQLISKSRTKNIANARHIAMYLCRKHLDLPFIKIGEEFGKRDHSTVISSCDKVDKQCKNDEVFLLAIKEIERSLI
jgi:chromosomal replication initiator protein